jgi:hypothetical protein
MASWKCSCCGEFHDSVPNSFGFDEPYHWGNRSRTSPPEGCWLNPDYCVIDDTDHFIRAVLEIPIRGSDEQFVLGIWTTLSPANFERERQLISDPSRVNEPPYFGWFANQLWQYPNTLNLKCNVISRAVGQRPCVQFEPIDHLLALEQRNGISYERFLELSGQFLHGWKHPESGIA